MDILKELASANMTISELRQVLLEKEEESKKIKIEHEKEIGLLKEETVNIVKNIPKVEIKSKNGQISIQELSKEKMDIVKELAKASIKVSETQNVIFKLKQDEELYIKERELKTIERIDNILLESRDLLKKTHENYKEVHDICNSIEYISNFVSEVHGKIKDTISEFEIKNDKWDKEVIRQQEEFKEIGKKIDIDKAIISNDKKTIEKEKKAIEEAKKLIESRQAQIKVALQLLENKQKKYE